MANKPDEFPVFSHIDKKSIDQMGAKIIKLLSNLSSVLGIDTTEIIKSVLSP